MSEQDNEFGKKVFMDALGGDVSIQIAGLKPGPLSIEGILISREFFDRRQEQLRQEALELETGEE